jgi:NAD(P)-dependent dehydrogenase (short-subunit alcohol dehydrogenase family)
VGVTLSNVVAVVTGGAGGIGRALAHRFAAEGARAVVLADVDGSAAATAATTVDCSYARGISLDVCDEAAVRDAVAWVEAEVGPVDVWCSNAGVVSGPGLGDDADWQRCFQIHVMAHVYAARHMVTRMVARGHGHLMVTASAAGLLTEMDTAPYPVTKHGSVALAEWLAIQYGDTGVSVSCLCPQGVRTAMTDALPEGSATLAAGSLIEPEEVADAVVAALAEGRFLIMPHPEVAEYERRRAADRERWLAGMRRTRAQLSTHREG